MLPPVMTKYAFRIRTKVGLVVDNLLIQGRDEGDAERKLRQMYQGCEIIACGPASSSGRAHFASFEEVAGLITR